VIDLNQSLLRRILAEGYKLHNKQKFSSSGACQPGMCPDTVNENKDSNFLSQYPILFPFYFFRLTCLYPVSFILACCKQASSLPGHF
jgi:hypothetical protein